MTKYLRYFESTSAATEANDLVSPLVTTINGYSKVLMKRTTANAPLKIVMENGAPCVEHGMLTFTCVEDGNISLTNYNGNEPNLSYSLNDGEWVDWKAASYSGVALTANDVLKVKGDNPDGFSSYSASSYTNIYSKFVMTGKIKASGSVMSLLDNGNYNVKAIPCDYCFYCLFANCTSLTTAPVLPATTLAECCYDSMFYDCTSLTTAPELPATTLVRGCYSYMFYGCTSLTSSPYIIGTNIASGSLSWIIRGTNLSYFNVSTSGLAEHLSTSACNSSGGAGLIQGEEHSLPVHVNGVFYANSYYQCMCFAKGTNINLSDGSFKKVEDIDYNDELLVWDFDNACLAAAKPLWISMELKNEFYFKCTFSDGTVLNLVGPKSISHRVFSLDKNRFEYPQYCVGDRVYTKNGICTLDSVDEIDEEVLYYNIITDYHINLFAESILTSCRYSNIYPVEEMKYVKDGREIVPFEMFEKEGISKEYYNGMRLGEQPIRMDAIKEYINKLIELRKD